MLGGPRWQHLNRSLERLEAVHNAPAQADASCQNVHAPSHASGGLRVDGICLMDAAHSSLTQQVMSDPVMSQQVKAQPVLSQLALSQHVTASPRHKAESAAVQSKSLTSHLVPLSQEASPQLQAGACTDGEECPHCMLTADVIPDSDDDDDSCMSHQHQIGGFSQQQQAAPELPQSTDEAELPAASVHFSGVWKLAALHQPSKHLSSKPHSQVMPLPPASTGGTSAGDGTQLPPASASSAVVARGAHLSAADTDMRYRSQQHTSATALPDVLREDESAQRAAESALAEDESALRGKVDGAALLCGPASTQSAATTALQYPQPGAGSTSGSDQAMSTHIGGQAVHVHASAAQLDRANGIAAERESLEVQVGG